MNFILIKKFFFSKHFKIFYATVAVFILLDVIFSNTFVKNIIKKDCLNYTKYSINGKNYFNYDLEKNCKAYETKKTVKTYKVFTDQNGFRTSGKKKKKKNDSVIFLGDSFTYGLGLNYEESIPGQVERKNIDFNIYNLGIPGYSPLALRFRLQEALKIGIKPKKIFYLMDLTDVHDESNRWFLLDDHPYPLILDKKTQEEIKKVFNFKNNFKMSRLLVYNLNKIVRNFRKEINQKKFIEEDKFIGKTLWGSFTHTTPENLDKSFWIENDYKEGIKNIKLNVKLIAEIAKNVNSEFYIVIYPWAETLQYGEDYFSWQNFANELCNFSSCTKVISAFSEFEKVKKKYSHWKKEIYILQDIHLNENGNKILAEVIYNEAFR